MILLPLSHDLEMPLYPNQKLHRIRQRSDQIRQLILLLFNLKCPVLLLIPYLVIIVHSQLNHHFLRLF